MKDDSNRSLRRVNRKSRSAADRTVEVDSSAFFAEDPSPTPPPRKKPGSSAPRRSGAPAQAAAAGRENAQPQVPAAVKGKTGQLTVHGKDGRIVSAVGAHKVARALF
jgi:hypothetical protein